MRMFLASAAAAIAIGAVAWAALSMAGMDSASVYSSVNVRL